MHQLRIGHEVYPLPVELLRPSPENAAIYRPIDELDESVRDLAESIARMGVIQPLVVSLDSFIIAGHRRYAAARVAGLATVPCLLAEIRREENISTWPAVLAECNRAQRVKSFDEVLREEVLSCDPAEAYKSLIEHRREKSDLSIFVGEFIGLGQTRARKRISAAKMPFLDAVKRIIDDSHDFWPLSDRQIHYRLLNDPPRRHAKKRKSVYQNDLQSYKDLTDLLTRARLAGLIDWNSIDDETRPFTRWEVFTDPSHFLRRELDGFLKGYWRDLQQSQPNHVEIFGEKLTVKSIVERVAEKYCIPVTIGRGYCSITPRRRLAERFTTSGRQNLIVLQLSDLDPDGEQLGQSFARSMRDDFGIPEDRIKPVKVAITSAQVRNFGLPPKLAAKKTSPHYHKFVSQHGAHAYELESLAPQILQSLLTEAIDSVIDVTNFNQELDAEKRDSAKLQKVQKEVRETLSSRIQ